MENSYDESETLKDLLSAEREGEQEGLRIPLSEAVPLNLKENGEQAIAMLTRDKDELDKVRKSLVADSRKAIDVLDAMPLRKDVRNTSLDALKKNQADHEKSLKPRSFIKRFFNY